MPGIAEKVAGVAASKVANKAATETWRTATLKDPPDPQHAPLLRVIAWSALTGAAVSVARTLVVRALSRNKAA